MSSEKCGKNMLKPAKAQLSLEWVLMCATVLRMTLFDLFMFFHYKLLLEFVFVHAKPTILQSTFDW